MTHRMVQYVVVVAVAFLQGCPPVEPLPPVDKPTCESACMRMAELECRIAEPTPEGSTCVEVCENTLDSTLPYDVACLSRAATCDGCDER